MSRKRNFDAKKNDIWCVGVTLFMMLTGTAPWKIAKESDESYKCMTNGFMKGLLKSWDLTNYVDEVALDLFEGIFEGEMNRIDIRTIKAHPWLRV